MKVIQSIRKEFNREMIGYLAIMVGMTAIICFFWHLPS